MASAPATLFYIDLDDFEPVNDELGHEMGDRLLMAVADRLRAGTRAQDVVARLGGDEFAVLVAGHDDGAIAARLARAFDDPFVLDGHVLRIGASIGTATAPADPDALLRAADEAMFAVKRQRTRRAPATRL
jgi:diguanylate cyclase (GGDEF)-like protein